MVAKPFIISIMFSISVTFLFTSQNGGLKNSTFILGEWILCETKYL
jgi:hypothetical protein